MSGYPEQVRVSRVRKRVEGVACDEGEMAVHLRGDGEEGGLRCSERVRVIVENGYYGSVRAEAMMAEAVRFYVFPSDWRQVRGVEMVGESEGRVERSECVDGLRSVCTCWTRELEWFVLSAEVGVKSMYDSRVTDSSC